MPRRSLEILAQTVAAELASGTEGLSKRTLRDVGVFARAIGTTTEKFLAYAPSTRRKYIAAAKKGRTVAQERERVRGVRKKRQKEKIKEGPTADKRWQRVMYLRDELQIEGINAVKGSDTATDQLDFDDLLSVESLRSHVQTYGFTYVIDRMKGQLDAIQEYNRSGGRDRDIGRQRMSQKFGHLNRRNFKASDAVKDDDERWYWYHANTLHFG